MAEVSVSLLEFDQVNLKPGDTAEIGISVSAAGFGPVTSLPLTVEYYIKETVPTPYGWYDAFYNSVSFDSEHSRTLTIPINNGVVSEDFLFDISFPLRMLNTYTSGLHDLFLKVSGYWYDAEQNQQFLNFEEKIGVTHAVIQTDPEGSTPVLIDVKNMSDEQLKIVFEHIASLQNAAIKSVELEQNGTLYEGDDFTTLTLALLTQDHWKLEGARWYGRPTENPTTVDFMFEGQPLQHILEHNVLQFQYEEFLKTNDNNGYVINDGIFTSSEGWTVDLGFLFDSTDPEDNFVIWRVLEEQYILIFDWFELVGYIDLDTRSYSAFHSNFPYIHAYDDFMFVDAENNSKEYIIADGTIFDLSGNVLNTYSGMNITINLGNNFYTQIVSSNIQGEIRPNTYGNFPAIQNIDLNDINNPLFGATIPSIVPSGYWEQISEKLVVSNGSNQSDSSLFWINQRATGNDGILMGLETADLLLSFDGNDLIASGDGDDTLDGGAGNDTLYGGSGLDIFKFSIAHGQDTIKDFDISEDKIDYSGANTDFASWKKSLDSSGNDKLTFESNDTENFVVIENENASEELKFNINKDISLELISDQETKNIFIDSTGHSTAVQADFNSVKISGITNFSTQISSETVDADPITISDVVAQLRDIVGLDILHGKAAAAADIDNDGEVQIADVVSNLRHIVGLDETDTFDLVTDNGFAINALQADSVGNLYLVINGDADLSHAEFLIA